MIRRLGVPTQTPRLQPHGHAEPAAPGRAALGPSGDPDLLRGLGAARGLVSAGPRPCPPGPDCGWLHPGEAWGLFSSPSSVSVHFPTSRFVVYKLPASDRYKYLDAGSGGWRDGTGSMDNLKGAVGRSLLPLYRNTSQVKGARGVPAEPRWDSRGARPGGKLHVAPSISPSLPSYFTMTSHLITTGLRTLPAADTRRVRPDWGLEKGSGFLMHFPQLTPDLQGREGAPLGHRGRVTGYLG